MEYDLKDIDKAAAYVIASAKSDTLLFNAPMGSGKTTLITEICKQLGVEEAISSPTYNIVNEYESCHKPIYHFDLYRINSIDELYDIGAEDYIDSPSLKLIEWPDIIIPLTTNYQVINIIMVNTTTRQVRVSDVVHR